MTQGAAVRLTQSSAIDEAVASRLSWVVVTPVGFEPTQLALVELESTPLDHSGKVSLSVCKPVTSELLLARS